MSSLKELYQEVILDHNRSPRNFHVLEGEGIRQAEGDNPLCGDKITVFLRMEGERVAEVAFQGAGCAISQASASLMTEALTGKSRDEVEALFTTFVSTMKGATPASEAPSLGKLEALAGVKDYPMRVKCATLAWHTLHAALEGAHEAVSTE
jgi:nitrogen fixation NifU-like protein